MLEMPTRFLLAAVLASLAALAQAQSLEIIPLRHRTPDQVLPALRPLLEPGGTLSGHSNQLFLRASPANVAEIRRALETLDQPLRRLLISVRFDDDTQSSRLQFDASGRISNRGSSVDIRAQDAQARSGERVDQRLQILDGSEAFIFAGSSLDAYGRASGFMVRPQLVGSRVQVEVAAQRDVAESSQRAATTLSARLGEWFEIGATQSSAARDARGIGSTDRSASSGVRRVWLRVDEVRN